MHHDYLIVIFLKAKTKRLLYTISTQTCKKKKNQEKSDAILKRFLPLVVTQLKTGIFTKIHL